MEYNGTLLDYVKQAAFQMTTGRKQTLKRLEMLNDKSYQFYTDSDGAVIANSDYTDIVLTCPPSMFQFKEFATVGDFLRELADYLKDNPVKTWDELAIEMDCASGKAALNNMSVVYSQKQVVDHYFFAADMNATITAVSGFSDIATHLLAVCDSNVPIVAPSCLPENISYFTVDDASKRIYKFDFVHTYQTGGGHVYITFELPNYIEPEQFDKDDPSIPATCFIDGKSDYYATLNGALADAVSGEKIIVFRDSVLTQAATIPVGVTVLIPSSGAYTDVEAPTVTYDRNHGGAAYETLTLRNTLTVAGTLIIGGNTSGKLLTMGQRTGDYGAVKIVLSTNPLVVGALVADSGTIYANGMIYGDTAVLVRGGTLYTLMSVSDWPGGTSLYGRYEEDIWQAAHYDFINLPKVKVSYGTVYARMNVTYRMWGSQRASHTDFPLVKDNDGFIQLTTGGLEITKSDGRYMFTFDGDASINDITVNSDMTVTTKYLDFPIPGNVDIVIATPQLFSASLTVNTNGLKFLPGATLTVEDGTELIVSPISRMLFYMAEDYSGEYFDHYTYDPNIGTADATLTVETGGTLTLDSEPTSTAAQTLTQPSSGAQVSWTISGNSATVRARSVGTVNGYSKNLTLTASADGYISFDYVIPPDTTLGVSSGEATNTLRSSGTFRRRCYSGDTVSIGATFEKQNTEYRTVSISNVIVISGGAGRVESSDSGLSNIPHTGTATVTDSTREHVIGQGNVEVPFYAE